MQLPQMPCIYAHIIILTCFSYLQTIDLYESRDLAQVQVALYKLGSAAQKNGFMGPVIGVKVAEKNVRKFDESRKKDGMNVIGLQVCM